MERELTKGEMFDLACLEGSQQRKDLMKENMKSDSFDEVYTIGGGTEKRYKETNKKSYPQEVEAVVKALGTMVLINESIINPQTLRKEHLGTIQEPILTGENRLKAEKKLIELIENL